MQVKVTLNVTFVPPLETNNNMTCRLGGEYIGTVIESNKIQCTIIEPSSGRSKGSTKSCNVSAIQITLIVYS